MDTSLALVILGTIVLVAYLLDFIGRRWRVPSVVLLIFSGMAVRAATNFFGLSPTLPDWLLPVLGTLGLILIVLEGALDLSLTRNHFQLVARTATCALLGIVFSGLLVAGLILTAFEVSVSQALLLATPFAIISSAVAIPAAGALAPRLREFVIYESSLSDIIGVVFFYALLSFDGNVGQLFVSQVGEITLSIAVGLAAAVAIFWLIQHIDHHVRVLPMIFGLVLLYGLGKMAHLAPLVLILLVGLLLNNSFLIERMTMGKLKASASFESDLESFKHLTAEFTFVMRCFFFVLLGFSTEFTSLGDPMAWALAAGIVVCSLLPRLPLLRHVAQERAKVLIFFAPRGLITVLLLLSIPSELAVPGFPNATVMLVILMWALLLTYGSVRMNDSAVVAEAAAK